MSMKSLLAISKDILRHDRDRRSDESEGGAT
jgi:hypothetical protein